MRTCSRRRNDRQSHVALQPPPAAIAEINPPSCTARLRWPPCVNCARVARWRSWNRARSRQERLPRAWECRVKQGVLRRLRNCCNIEGRRRTSWTHAETACGHGRAASRLSAGASIDPIARASACKVQVRTYDMAKRLRLSALPQTACAAARMRACSCLIPAGLCRLRSANLTTLEVASVPGGRACTTPAASPASTAVCAVILTIVSMVLDAFIE